MRTIFEPVCIASTATEFLSDVISGFCLRSRWVKTRILLDTLVAPKKYVPIDICRAQLMRSSSRLRAAYPRLPIKPVVADFTSRFEFPQANLANTLHSHLQ